MSTVFLSAMLVGLVLLLVSVMGLVISTAMWIEKKRRAMRRVKQKQI